ncbi:recombinase family protein [Komagataeibacter intermedius]|uniref:Transposase n=1 Tax=Komagataeibacter intermedius AF2 TaxID=1458464 RepID=A0A0N1F913_9PROT|nr:recombinase family protein [Komagataeibacter intermedius]KPH85079.1 transposase [Komagataeibacter intermedius AF2]
MRSELVLPIHLGRKAIVYVRQSTPSQIISNQESLRLQYALKLRARELGWKAGDVEIIDADLGLSGASTLRREGFRELVGRVGLGEVGLILSIDVTRLARNCSDWYPLLDICGLQKCLIADRDGVYDPASPNGRLLLGLKGTISELELHTIRSRLTAGLLAKAERGALALTLPIGFVRNPGGAVVKDPNVEVQGRLAFLFSTFLKVKSVSQVMRHLNRNGLDLPARDRHGDLHWTAATLAAVARILRNPAYAGAFVYGRTRLKAQRPGNLPQKTPRPIDEWRIVVRDQYPGYIDWQTYLKIRHIMNDNKVDYMRTNSRGVPRNGGLLLHGIVRCARCGHKMYVRYQNGGEYVCNHLRTHQGLPTCQHVRAPAIDAAVTQAFLEAVAPAEFEAFSAAYKARRQSVAEARRGLEQQLERRRYEATLAERQFNKVDPDNRLVAAELERRWETALNDVRTAEEALSRSEAGQPASPLVLPREMGAKVVHIQGRLPKIWHDPATDDARRKALLRCLVEQVVLNRGEHETGSVRIIWRGGLVTELAVPMTVSSVDRLERGAEMRARILVLATSGLNDSAIAATLTAEGHRSPACVERVLPTTVAAIRRDAGIVAAHKQTRWAHDTCLLSAVQLAKELSIPVNWLYVQIRKGRLVIDPASSGAHLFRRSPEVFTAIRRLRNREIEHVDLRINRREKRGH